MSELIERRPGQDPGLWKDSDTVLEKSVSVKREMRQEPVVEAELGSSSEAIKQRLQWIKASEARSEATAGRLGEREEAWLSWCLKLPQRWSP